MSHPTPASTEPQPEAGNPHTHHPHPHDPDPHDAAEGGHLQHGLDPAAWDARYAENERLWSGNANQALVDEAADLTPGRALDVGCGEGADAIWLAQRGWKVSAIDPSNVALERAREAAVAAGQQISWWLGSLADADLPREAFNLVSVMYGVLPLDSNPVSTLAGLVAPGGTLLVVHHAEVDRERALQHGFDPDSLMSPDDVAAGLGSGWEVVTHEQRDRHLTEGAGAEHTRDVVVRAVKR